jgi:hypothetical protein
LNEKAGFWPRFFVCGVEFRVVSTVFAAVTAAIAIAAFFIGRKYTPRPQ